jgi:predicted amidophosphoribosyltransferase
VQRRDNVQNAFQALPERVFGKKILLVDDVATSGSTLNACADALLQGGANAVYGLTLARAVLSSKP